MALVWNGGHFSRQHFDYRDGGGGALQTPGFFIE